MIYPEGPRLDNDNRCMGNWWGKQIYIIGGESWVVQAVPLEPGFYSVGGYNGAGSIKIDGAQRVIEVYNDMTRERAETVMKTMIQLVHLEEMRANEYQDRQAKTAAAYAVYASRGGAYVRPPEPVYEPGGSDVRLTPVPRNLLIAMRNGAVLHERTWRWTQWHIGAPGTPFVRIAERGINALREFAFIARDGVLPDGNLTRFHEFDWSITPAGHAWLAANAKPAAPAAQPQETT